MDNAHDDPPLRPEGVGGSAAGPGSGASGVREPRKPRIEVLRDVPPEASGPALAASAREPRIEALEGGARGSAQQQAPGMHPPEPERMQAPVRRKRGGLLNSQIPLLAVLALLVLIAGYGYFSSQGEADSEPGDTEFAAGSEVPDVAADAERDYETQPADEPRVERTAEQDAPLEQPSRTDPADAAAARTPDSAAPAEPAEPAEAEVSTSGDETSALATVRAFYGALSAGDGVAAAQWVVPAKRRSGPLSAGQLDRYFSSFRRPLRLRRVTPVDADTVRVAYDYVLADGRLCEGQASVEVTRSGDTALVSRIRTRGPC